MPRWSLRNVSPEFTTVAARAPISLPWQRFDVTWRGRSAPEAASAPSAPGVAGSL